MKTKKRDAARRQKNTKLILITSILLILTPLLVFAANDTQDPIIISAAPTGVLNTNNVDLIVYTDENTDCKYDTTNTDYDSMTYSFSTTNTTTHTEGLILSDADYYYYVLCKDYANNTMTNPETISFTIDTITPTILSAQPSGVLNTDYTTLVIITDENTVCKYDEENESHDDKTYTFEDTNSTSST
ncbi:hypothetical protein GOV05_04330, partial [Candidatus Woesearchaeota archaeon]|nr:hypothetical protein [Candidatus Woesearchaeota archaeon]